MVWFIAGPCRFPSRDGDGYMFVPPTAPSISTDSFSISISLNPLSHFANSHGYYFSGKKSMG
jgi:hypothetical protein